MIKLVCFLGLSWFSLTCIAGELMRDAYIAEVANTYSNGAGFAVRMNGGTGIY